MRHLLVVLAVASLTACASSKPPPKTAQDEEPIRTQEEIARDQASSTGPTALPAAEDPRCKQHPKAPGCKPKSGSPFDNSARRNPFVYDESGHSNPGNPANQSR